MNSLKSSYLLFIIYFSFCTCVAINTNEFPKDFLFGTATSAYQVEGAWKTNGKGENIWDRFTHEHPQLILDSSNGDVACDSYHKIADDVALIKNLGVSFYRFSLSWSRILPEGLDYKINPDGIRYYNQLIDALLEQNITPFVTLYHWDLPQPLQDLGGFASERMVKWFEDYARVCFENFGDRVKWWLTFNEPIELCLQGYGGNGKAPGLQSSGYGEYICGHNLLKAHARTYHLYNQTFRPTQNGSISVALNSPWVYPKRFLLDNRGAERYRQFLLGWFSDPIFHSNGNYPEVMRTFIADRSKKEGFRTSRLPTFTEEEIKNIKGTYDFFAINHYSSLWAQDVEDSPYNKPNFYKDIRCIGGYREDWPSSASPWLKVVPEGFRLLLNWIKNRYGNVPIYVTENGYSDHGELDDQKRINYYKLYLSALLDAIYTDGVNVKGYTAWSLLDNFEWRDGYVNRFGLHHVDFNDPDRKRQPKASAIYLKSVFANRSLV